MIVRILKETPYTPAADESPRCFGQLRLRPTIVTQDVVVEVTRPDGTTERITTTQTTCGPMERYFPIGARPDLKDNVAAGFIAAEIAEAVDEQVRFVAGEDLAAMLNDVKVQ